MSSVWKTPATCCTRRVEGCEMDEVQGCTHLQSSSSQHLQCLPHNEWHDEVFNKVISIRCLARGRKAGNSIERCEITHRSCAHACTSGCIEICPFPPSTFIREKDERRAIASLKGREIHRAELLSRWSSRKTGSSCPGFFCLII